MYDEIKKDLKNDAKERMPRRAPEWGKAIKNLLSEKSDIKEPLAVNWLARRTSINEKNLHNIIAGRVRDPSSDKLVQIADAFGIAFSEFAARAMAEDEGNFYVCGYAERGYIDYPQHGFSIQSFSPRSRSQRDFFWGRMTIKPFKDLRKWKFDTNATVGLFLESGTLEIQYGSMKRQLHANEAVYFDAGIPHRIKNVDSIEATLFIVTNPPLH